MPNSFHTALVASFNSFDATRQLASSNGYCRHSVFRSDRRRQLHLDPSLFLTPFGNTCSRMVQLTQDSLDVRVQKDTLRAAPRGQAKGSSLATHEPVKVCLIVNLHLHEGGHPGSLVEMWGRPCFEIVADEIVGSKLLACFTSSFKMQNPELPENASLLSRGNSQQLSTPCNYNMMGNPIDVECIQS